MNATFVAVMPTLGRPTLAAAISSCVDQLEADDLLLVVGDSANGRTDCAAAIVSDFQPASVRYVDCFHAGSRYGNHQRDYGLMLAAGRSSHICFLDDDDVWTFGALDRMREHVSHSPDAAHIFRAEWGPGHHAHGVKLWVDREVRESNFGTCQVVLPNRHYQRKWMDGNERGTVSDYAWMSAAIGECDGVEWHEDVVAVVRP